MSAVEQRSPDDYYTPDRLRMLLRLYPYMNDAKMPEDPEMKVMTRRAFGPGASWEEATVKRADLDLAFRFLKSRDWRAEYTLRAYYCVGLSLRDIAGYLDRIGEGVHHETVNRWRKDSLELMSAFLCGRFSALDVVEGAENER